MYQNCTFFMYFAGKKTPTVEAQRQRPIRLSGCQTLQQNCYSQYVEKQSVSISSCQNVDSDGEVLRPFTLSDYIRVVAGSLHLSNLSGGNHTLHAALYAAPAPL